MINDNDNFCPAGGAAGGDDDDDDDDDKGNKPQPPPTPQEGLVAHQPNGDADVLFVS